jgi:hypothetical protein
VVTLKERNTPPKAVRQVLLPADRLLATPKRHWVAAKLAEPWWAFVKAAACFFSFFFGFFLSKVRQLATVVGLCLSAAGGGLDRNNIHEKFHAPHYYKDQTAGQASHLIGIGTVHASTLALGSFRSWSLNFDAIPRTPFSATLGMVGEERCPWCNCVTKRSPQCFTRNRACQVPSGSAYE